MDRESVEEILLSLHGPTADLAAEMARVGYFSEAIVTLPDTNIIGVSARFTTPEFKDPAPTGLQSWVSVSFSTSVQAQEAMLALQAGLEADGFTLRSSDTDTKAGVGSADRNTYKAEFDGDYHEVVRLRSSNHRDGTTVAVEVVVNRPGEVATVSSTGWYAESPFVEKAVPLHTWMNTSTDWNSDIWVGIETKVWFPTLTKDEVRAAAMALANPNGWTFIEESGTGHLLMEFEDLESAWLWPNSLDSGTTVAVAYNRFIPQD